MKIASTPLSRPIRVETIPRDGVTVNIEADEAERAALAKFNDLPAVDRLAATFELRPKPGGVVDVSGKVAADVVQTCVVSLEPFAAKFVEPVDVRFAPPEAAPARQVELGNERDNAAGDEDASDPIVDGAIDLGALAAEFLTLGLDPYPRKPGVSFETSGESRSTEASPFRELADPKKGG
jgi:Large ribosomal RNA subunit accumulation protein YceD